LKFRFWLRPQPVDATHWLNRLAGVSKFKVFLGRSLSCLAFIMREPIGVVSSISAFNHPLNLIIRQVVPAESAPHTAQYYPQLRSTASDVYPL